jgi:hypothetical protein
MDQSNRLVSENPPLGRLVENALGELKQLGYSRRSLNRYRAIWEHFIEFSRQKKLGDEFSGNLAARFVEEYPVGNEVVDEPGERWRRNIVVAVKVLEDFAHHGRIGRARTGIEEIRLCPATKKVLQDYKQYTTRVFQSGPRCTHRTSSSVTARAAWLPGGRLRPWR